MRLWKRIACGLGVLGVCSTAPYGVAASEHTTARSVSGYRDASVEQTLREMLDRNPSFGEIVPSVTHGIVTLTGTVTHYQDKLDAEEMARRQPGVRSVRDEISLNAPAVEDSELEERVEDRLRFARADIGLSFPQIQVEAHQGIVSLSGTVNDSIEHAAALSLVGNTDGVVAVRDRLSVDPSLLNDETARVRINKAIYRVARSSGEIGVGGAMPVRASFADGSVTLMGAVADEKTKEELLSRVRDVYGVVTVDDEIMVRNSPTVQSAAAHPVAPCVQSKEVANTRD